MAELKEVSTSIRPSRLPIPASVAKEFDLQPAQWRVLVEQIFPNAKSVESVMMALSYCRTRGLDIYKRPVHVVPMWSSALGKMTETVWPSISEIRTTATRTQEYAGIDAVEFGPVIERSFEGVTDKWENGNKLQVTIKKKLSYPEWASVVVYRVVKGVKYAFHTKIFWEESYASIGKTNVPNDMWEKRPRGQLDKCVEAAALRKAFPEEVGGMYAAEEMEGRTIDHDVVDRSVELQSPPTPPKPSDVGQSPPAPPSARQEPVITSQTESAQGSPSADYGVNAGASNEVTDIDPETGEVIDDSSSADFFYELETALMAATSIAGIAIAWDKSGVDEKFSSSPGEMDTALAIKARAVKKVKEAAST